MEKPKIFVLMKDNKLSDVVHIGNADVVFMNWDKGWAIPLADDEGYFYRLITDTICDLKWTAEGKADHWNPQNKEYAIELLRRLIGQMHPTKNAPLEVEEMVRTFLVSTGHDGLINLDLDCACWLDDLMPCVFDSYPSGCQACYKIPKSQFTPGEQEEYGDCEYSASIRKRD